MTKREIIIELIQEMSIGDAVMLHNEYCYETNRYDDEIFECDRFDEVFDGYTPTDISNRIHFGDYNPYAEYFTFNGYGNIHSVHKYEVFDHIYEDEIADYIIENDNDFGFDDIRDILDAE